MHLRLGCHQFSNEPQGAELHIQMLTRFCITLTFALLGLTDLSGTYATTMKTPEWIYRAIAQETLVSSDGLKLMRREAEVRQWITDNGGDAIFQGYLVKFGLPDDKRDWYEARQMDIVSPKLGYYYLTHLLTSGSDAISSDCIHSNINLFQSPTVQGLCALSQWDAYQLTGDDTYAHALLIWADSFIERNIDGKIQWTNTLVPAFGITKTPWISALTQSVAVSTLLRAFQYTSDPKYINAATSAFKWLTIPVADGGLLSKDQGTWLEEYPNQDPKEKSGHVLNGNVWALFGVWDYYRVTRDPKAFALFDSAYAAIKRNMNWYDLGYWNVYSRLNRVDAVTGRYMQFIVQQMYALAEITSDSYFRSLGDRWKRDQQTYALFVHSMAQTYMESHSP